MSLLYHDLRECFAHDSEVCLKLIGGGAPHNLTDGVCGDLDVHGRALPWLTQPPSTAVETDPEVLADRCGALPGMSPPWPGGNQPGCRPTPLSSPWSEALSRLSQTRWWAGWDSGGNAESGRKGKQDVLFVF